MKLLVLGPWLAYLVSDQTRMEFPWQVTAESENPPVSSRMLTTSVGYMNGFRHTCRSYT